MENDVNTAKEVGQKLRVYFEEKGMTQQQVAEKLGIKQQNVGVHYSGIRPFGKNAALKWQRTFGFNAQWLMTGEGKMMLDSVITQTNVNGNNVIAHTINNIADTITPSTPSDLDDLVPIVPRDIARMPNISIWEYMRTNTDTASAPKIYQFPRYDFYFQCVTDAMRPEIMAGDLLGIRKYDTSAPLINGEAYVIDTKSAGMIIRMLEEKEDGYIASAHNDRYKDTFFPRSEILSIFTIVGLVRVK